MFDYLKDWTEYIFCSKIEYLGKTIDFLHFDC